MFVKNIWPRSCIKHMASEGTAIFVNVVRQGVAEELVPKRDILCLQNDLLGMTIIGKRALRLW